MGVFFSNIFSRLFEKKEMRLLMGECVFYLSKMSTTKKDLYSLILIRFKKKIYFSCSKRGILIDT